MASRGATEGDIGVRAERVADRTTGVHDETKWAPLTTEFWAMVVLIGGILISAASTDTLDAEAGLAVRGDRRHWLHRQPRARQGWVIPRSGHTKSRQVARRNGSAGLWSQAPQSALSFPTVRS